MTQPQSTDEESPGDQNNNDDEPSRSEFDALLKRIQTLEGQLQSQQQQEQQDENGAEKMQTSLKESIVGLEKVEESCDEFELPESTYTFLITEPIFSTPSAIALVTYAGSLLCLALALKNEIDSGTDDNYYNIAEVTTTVRTVQYLGIIIGVLMDDEIPTGLELIGKALEQKKEGDGVFPQSKIIFSSILRISVGMIFLTSLFFVVVQEDNVLDILFDVVALEFIESIDDIIFGLCRRGFFSRQMRVVANQELVLHCSSHKDARKVRKWFKRLVRTMYFASMVIMLFGLSVITSRQAVGAYGCRSLIVNFGDGLWEEAWVKLDVKCSNNSTCIGTNQQCYIEDEDSDGFCYEKRLLIYSHFNGYYIQDGILAERPRYLERNKENGEKFTTTTPAELEYCQDIESWVLRHPDIRASLDNSRSNECNWLLRSHETEEFDLVELSRENWFLWKGRIEKDYQIDIKCAECANDSDCNYFGRCVWDSDEDQKCECLDGRFGVFCEHELPCEMIRSEKDSNVKLQIVKDLDKDGDNIDFVSVYGSPMYSAKMEGVPYGVMRDGFPGKEDKYFEVVHPENASVAVVPHKHTSPDDYSDDDFFQINNESTVFQELMTNYTFLLRYTGSRWYGQILDPTLSGASFKEEEYHAFWMNSFSGLGQQDNQTLIISELTSKVSPVNVDFFEMRRRNKILEGEEGYNYSPYGVMIPLVAREGSGFFHCNNP